MKNILDLTTALDITEWENYFLVVRTINPDPVTQLDRVAIVRNIHIDPEETSVLINVVLYILDTNGNPINGKFNTIQKNIIPIEVPVTANNNSYVNLFTMQVNADISGLEEGIDYLLPEDCKALITTSDIALGVSHLPEFEAYRLIAKSSPIDLFALMINAIVQSTKI